MVAPVEGRRREEQANPLFHSTLRADREGPSPVNWVVPCFQEKPLSEPISQPYRKRTHVGEERILRRSRELWLRNSAKWSRNFGRRDALRYVNRFARGADEGRRESALATV